MLLPAPAEDLADAAVDAVYAWPADRPWLRANMVATVDGAARAPGGLSRGISSRADKRLFGALRGLADVILVGAGTARAESYGAPSVRERYAAARTAAGQSASPALAVVSRSLDFDPDAPMFTAAGTRTIVLTVAAADRARQRALAEVATVIVAGDRTVDLATGLTALHERGLRRVHCEGGPCLLAELVADDLLDELCLSVSPLLAGGGYAGGVSTERILTGSPLPVAPAPLSLRSVLEEDGSLFLRYGRAS